MILWVNIRVRPSPYWNSVFGTTWLRFSIRSRFRTRARNLVGPRPDNVIWEFGESHSSCCGSFWEQVCGSFFAWFAARTPGSTLHVTTPVEMLPIKNVRSHADSGQTAHVTCGRTRTLHYRQLVCSTKCGIESCMILPSAAITQKTRIASRPIFIRPFEKRDVLCRGNVRPSVRVFRTFLQHALRYECETWYIHSVGGTTCRVWVASQLGHFDLVYSQK